jgi:hypothetical protein
MTIQTTVSIKLKSIDKAKINDGGWVFNYDKVLPPNSVKYDVRLFIYSSTVGGALTNDYLDRLPSADMTGAGANFRLSYVFWRVNELNLWNGTANACLYIRSWDTNGALSSAVSNPLPFSAPIRPVFGMKSQPSKTNVDVFGAQLADNKVAYDMAHAPMMIPIFVFGIYYIVFHINYFIVTSDTKKWGRFSDCINFADAALALKSPNVSGLNGAAIAKRANAKPVHEGVDRSTVAEFFSASNKSKWSENTYLVWWDDATSGHVLIVSNNATHEYIDLKDSSGYHKNNDVHKRMINIPRLFNAL